MNLHLIGIGGVGMAGLAVLLKNRGHDVSGCDVHLGPRTAWLESQGVRVLEGHDPCHLEGVDQVIVTPAVHGDNPELAAARNIRYRGDVLAQLVSEHADAIAVCGSHGKTTTATWIAKLLLALGERVEWAIGGETGTFPVAGCDMCPSKVRPSSDTCLVVEADESDGTLAKYRAKMLVVTNCEYDHPDHFKTRADYFACYETARQNAGDVVEGVAQRHGDTEGWFAALAEHNKKNALMAMEVARRRGHNWDDIAKAMSEVVKALPDRRFQVIWPASNLQPSTLNLQPSTLNLQPSTFHLQPSVTVVTDYAHHPTEMRCAVEMARARCAGRLRVMFQPHRYSRTKALLDDFPAAFEGADEVVICPTYAAFEHPIEGGTSADLYREVRSKKEEGRSKDAPRFYLARTCEEAWTHCQRASRDGDWILVLGAGDLLFKLTEAPPQRLFIGMGTNTWKSDLDLPVTYVRTTGPANEPGATLGIPWMAGIPGTIGGWVKMNAGAFGHSISEVLDAVKVDGAWIAAADCGFGYRSSNIHGEIQDIRLREEARVKREEVRTAAYYLSKRKRFPAGTKGSVFKNPSGDYAGRLLEAADCKGLRVGGARVWEEHANVIVSDESATSSDFLALAQLMQNRVHFRFGVRLEPEVTGLV